MNEKWANHVSRRGEQQVESSQNSLDDRQRAFLKSIGIIGVEGTTVRDLAKKRVAFLRALHAFCESHIFKKIMNEKGGGRAFDGEWIKTHIDNTLGTALWQENRQVEAEIINEVLTAAFKRDPGKTHVTVQNAEGLLASIGEANGLREDRWWVHFKGAVHQATQIIPRKSAPGRLAVALESIGKQTGLFVAIDALAGKESETDRGQATGC